MKNLNKAQILGITFVIIGIATYFLVENDTFHVFAGVLSGIGVGLIVKWIPFKKRK